MLSTRHYRDGQTHRAYDPEWYSESLRSSHSAHHSDFSQLAYISRHRRPQCRWTQCPQKNRSPMQRQGQFVQDFPAEDRRAIALVALPKPAPRSPECNQTLEPVARELKSDTPQARSAVHRQQRSTSRSASKQFPEVPAYARSFTNDSRTLDETSIEL